MKRCWSITFSLTAVQLEGSSGGKKRLENVSSGGSGQLPPELPAARIRSICPCVFWQESCVPLVSFAKHHGNFALDPFTNREFAFELCWICVRSVSDPGSDLGRICVGSVSDLYRICVGSASDLRRNCVGSALDLCQICVRSWIGSGSDICVGSVSDLGQICVGAWVPRRPCRIHCRIQFSMAEPDRTGSEPDPEPDQSRIQNRARTGSRTGPEPFQLDLGGIWIGSEASSSSQQPIASSSSQQPEAARTS